MKRLKNIHASSVICIVAMLIVFIALTHFCFAGSTNARYYFMGPINNLGHCFATCRGGKAGSSCRKGCWGGYQMDIHPEILEAELNRRRREKELNRKKHEEELKKKKHHEELKKQKLQEEQDPGYRLIKI